MILKRAYNSYNEFTVLLSTLFVKFYVIGTSFINIKYDKHKYTVSHNCM